MSLIVQKFGGSSVATPERVMNAASIITGAYAKGNGVVAVVSAQGDTTDELIAKAGEISDSPNKRELDALMSAGEQMSMALLAMAVEKLGYPAKSLTGWQAGFETDSTHGNSRIRRIDTERLENELDKGNIVIVAGFQGRNRYDDITTLGRGGSDTSAVAIAAVLHADLCQIYTDVDGVFTADPRLVPRAYKLNDISYDEMLELAHLGAQVLHPRSVEMAKKYSVKLEVLSSLTRKPGTMIGEVTDVEKLIIKGVTKDNDISRLTVLGLQDRPGVAFRIFSALAARKIDVDLIVQSVSQEETKDITFTVSKEDRDEAAEALQALAPSLGAAGIRVDDDVCKISVVGAGMVNNPGIAARVFEALADAGINVQIISTSEIKISVIVARKDCDRALNAVHDAFLDD